MNFEFDLPSICHFNFAAHRQGDGKLGGGLKYVYFYFHPYLGKIPILTNIFQVEPPTRKWLGNSKSLSMPSPVSPLSMCS